MRVRFNITLWASFKQTNAGYATYCIELGTTYESKGASSAKAWFKARNDIDFLFRYWLDRGVLEDELLCRGWVVLKTYSTVQWHYPNPELRVAELQHLYREEGAIDKYVLEIDIPHAPKHLNTVIQEGVTGDVRDWLRSEITEGKNG